MKRLKHHALPILILLGVTGLFSLTLYFAPFSKETFGHDAGIFAHIGYALTKGVPLYTGAWDNKGPLLYFINALGILINYRYGIFLLEFIALFFTLFYMYKTARLFTSRYIAVICAILAIMPLTATLEGGNLSEEWALPFTAIAFYLIAKFFQNGFQLKRLEMMFLGVCISAIILLRLNIIMFIAVAVLSIIIILIYEKKIKTLLAVFWYALIGFIAFTLPFCIYLIANNCFISCIKTAYLGVLGSFTSLTFMQIADNVSRMILDFIPSGGFFVIILFILIFPFYLYTCKKQKSPLKSLLIICYFGLFATLIGNSVSGAYHPHYFMSFIPVMLLPIVWLAKGLHSLLARIEPRRFLSVAVIAALAFSLSIDSVVQLRTLIFKNQQDGTDLYLQSPQMQMKNFITENSDSDDTILVLGDVVAATSYYKSKRLSASNYFYYANGRFDDAAKRTFANEIFKDTTENHPKIILFETKAKWEDFIAHLDDAALYNNFIESNYTAIETTIAHKAYIHQ